MLTKIKSLKWVKALAMTGLVVTCAGVLSGCYIQSNRPYHHYYRPIVVVR